MSIHISQIPSVSGLAKGFARLLIVLVALLLGLPSSSAEVRIRSTGQILGYVSPMPDFTLLEQPRPVPPLSFTDASGRKRDLNEFAGRVVLINLWATWCAPCIREMPSLDRLQASLDPDRAVVVAISIDRGGMAKVGPFFERLGLKNLEIFVDSSMRTSRALKASGLPTSVLVDAKGREVGRIQGPAEWDTAAARALIRDIADRSLQ